MVFTQFGVLFVMLCFCNADRPHYKIIMKTYFQGDLFTDSTVDMEERPK